jgi:DNA mismatch repair protein MutL
MFAMAPDLVDINAHPAKLEVRFQDSGRVYSLLLGSIRNKFLTTDLTAKAELGRVEITPLAQVAGKPVGQNLQTETDRIVENQSRIPFRSSASPIGWTGQPSISGEIPSSELALGRPGGSRSSENATSHIDAPAPPQRDGSPFPNRLTALQVHNTYLIYETDEGMVVIDQHALHERIIYEQLRERVLGGKLETQRLLVPEPVTLLPAELAAVRENSELLVQLGMAIEPFGGDTVLVVAYPALLANQNLSEMLRGIVQLLMAESHRLDRRDLVDEILHMISCKAAVKAGDKLTPEEIQALLEHREYCQDSHHCPHGRPTALVFSRQELDRRFKRI